MHNYEIPILDSTITPEPFNLLEHLHIINDQHRQRRMTTCNDRYLLLMLDTSGSIGETVFKSVVSLLSDLIPLFCRNTKVAAITFGSHTYHEFCFNCSANNHTSKIQLALQNIPYHGGFTATGEAIKCACDEILTKKCGLPGKRQYKKCPAPIDVIVITDGRSNGGLNPCEAAKCLHNTSDIYDVNTFTIRVGENIGQDEREELKCIQGKNNNFSHIFNIKNFDALKNFFRKVKKFLKTPQDSGNGQPPSYRQCFDVNRPFQK